MIRRFLLHLLLAVAFLNLVAPSWGREPLPETRVMPRHLFHSIQKAPGTAADISVTITVDEEPPEGSSYYWAQMFYLDSGPQRQGYFGLQSGGIDGGKPVGKMAIFSMWNTVDVEGGPGATARPFDTEGDGHTVRTPFPWREDVPYTFHLEKDGPYWWRMTITSPGAPPLHLGRIKAAEDARIKGYFIAFSEYFTRLTACDALPYARVVYSDFLFGGKPLPPSVGRKPAPPMGNCGDNVSGAILGGLSIHESGIDKRP